MHVIFVLAFHGGGNIEVAWLVLLETESSCFPRGQRDAEDAERVGVRACKLLATCFQHCYMQTLHLKGSSITSLPSSR